jgi:hypothetical protein
VGKDDYWFEKRMVWGVWPVIAPINWKGWVSIPMFLYLFVPSAWIIGMTFSEQSQGPALLLCLGVFSIATLLIIFNKTRWAGKNKKIRSQ